MTYVGYTPTGDAIDLGAPILVTINRDEDAPADDFTGVFPFLSTMPPITVIRVLRGDELCFYGIVDEQTAQITSNGSTLKLIARSRAALLLDNEALPQTYIHPSLQTVFARHAESYGFAGFVGNPGTFNGEMTVTKGMSEWQAIQSFCSYFLGVAPKVTIDGLLDASGEKPKTSLHFSNIGGGVPYLSIHVCSKYHALISEINVQSGSTGEYYVKNIGAKAVALGVMRKRYLTATKSGNAYYNSKLMMKSARRKFEEIVVTCPGEFGAELGAQVTVADRQLGNFHGLSIAKIAYMLGSTGEFCRITLRNEE